MSLSLAETLAALPDSERTEALAGLSEAQQAALLYSWREFWARPDQLAPPGDWDIWLVLAGRGFGKTRTGCEWVREEISAGRASRVAIVAETAADARDVLVEGESGILSLYPRSERPQYEPSKRRLTWPNGAVGTLYNATEPDQLRGPQHDLALCDELAKWRYARETWDQLRFGLRLGANPRVCITTTPRPIDLIKQIVTGKEGRVAVTRGRTIDNRANLAEPFIRTIHDRYGGTRLGRQELDGEILGDVPNALFSMDKIEASRVRDRPSKLGKIYVSVDPAVTSTETSDYHGIVVVAEADNGRDAYVLDDCSIRGTPTDWARRAIALYDHYAADGIVVEVNQGGDMVSQTLRSLRATIPVREVRATRGKHVRAEPISALYEQGRVHHVGRFDDLEAQMTQMTSHGYEGDGSPDRLDALVWGLTCLFPVMTEDRTTYDRKTDPFARAYTDGGWMGY